MLVKYENMRQMYNKQDQRSWYLSQWASPPPLLFNYEKNQVKKCWLQIANSEWSEVITEMERRLSKRR